MIYKISLPNNKYGHLMPVEDSLKYTNNIFCVADGITRDPITPRDFTGLSADKILEKYPNPSGATMAADLFCETFIDFLNKKTASGKNIKQAFTKANLEIKKLNKKHIKKIDYLANDLFGCVASGGLIDKNILYWGGICDCGIIVYSSNGFIKFQTPNWMKPFEIFEKKHLTKPDYNWNLPEYRVVIRSKYRNNPSNVSYGAFTGESSVKEYINTGKTNVCSGDLVVFYTDGFEKTVSHKNFFKVIYHKKIKTIDKNLKQFSIALADENQSQFGRERTLIAVFI